MDPPARLEVADHLPWFARIAAGFVALMGGLLLGLSLFPEGDLAPVLRGVGYLVGPAFVLTGLYLAFGRRSATLDRVAGVVEVRRRLFGLTLRHDVPLGRPHRLRVVFRPGPRGGGAYWVYLDREVGGAAASVRLYRNPWPSGLNATVASLAAFTGLPVVDEAKVVRADPRA